MKWLTLLIAVFTLVLSSCDKPAPGYISFEHEVGGDTITVTIPDSGHTTSFIAFWINSDPEITTEGVSSVITSESGETPASFINAPTGEFSGSMSKVLINVPITVHSKCVPGTYTLTFTGTNRKKSGTIKYTLNALK